jgi:hypothetical protein
MLPTDLPPFYHKKMLTLHHSSIGGVTSAVWRFVHYSRWEGIISYPSLMTRDTLPRTLQTSLSDMNGGARGASFEPRLDMDHTPLAIGMLSSPSLGVPTPVYSGEGVGPSLSCLHLYERHFWVLAHSVFSKNPVLQQVKTAELMAMWDYEGKLESRGWS